MKMTPAQENIFSSLTASSQWKPARAPKLRGLGLGCAKAFIIFLLPLFISCKKKESELNQNVFVKSYAAGYDMAIAAGFQLHDGNYLIAGFDQAQLENGQMLKLDANGKLIWDKPLSPLVKAIWSAFPVPGTGYVIFGVNDVNSHAMNICLYNVDGNLISTDSVVTGAANYNKTPYNLMLLSNGNYVMAGGLVFNTIAFTMRILDPLFNVIQVHSIPAPAGKGLVYCKAMCEMPDASIAIAATVSEANGGKRNLFLAKTDLNGNFITSNFLNDTVYGETANAMVPHNGELFAVTAKMQGDVFGGESNNGMGVNYYGTFNDCGRLVSGMIQLSSFANDGQLTSQDSVTGYPKNGMMNSITATNDGEYILCGTVNQQNTYLVQSDTRIYLLKLDANLDVQWSKIFSSAYPALGVDAAQTYDGGYIVTGFHRALNKRFEALIIKTDANGNF